MVNRMNVRILIMALFGLCQLSPSPALAHAFLERANPAAGSTMQSAPPSVTITFTVPIESLFSVIEVHDAQGNRMDSGSTRASGNKSIAVDLPTLPPGTYTVIWQALSVDTHRTQGHFEFTVRP
jgi:copper resistance protein C